ncbi:hypothetical protein HDU85_000262 [Gaertneriomyces sp. JEL0708]|nr:hypothetical protein HDU85_000262 [Gaertneriomyces sp. JEL0708]
MSLFYQAVFCILLAEMTLFTILLIPLPGSIKRPMLQFLTKSPLTSQIRTYSKLVFIYVLIMFLDSLRGLYTRSNDSQHNHAGHHHDACSDAFARSKRLYDQRNLYLTGAVLFLSLILSRFLNMIADVLQSEQKMEVLKSQAAKQSKEYMRLLDKENTKDTEVGALKEKVKEAEKAIKELDIVKKQAKQTADEYMRLTDRYVALERKTSGFDEDSKSK